MKKITALLLCFLLLCTYALTAAAETPEGHSSDVQISVTVPDTHKITVYAEKSEAFYQGVSGDEFTVERLSTPRILIRPENGQVIKSVLLNGVDVTELLQGGYLDLTPVYEDQTLVVTTEDEPAPPQDTFTVKGRVTLNGQPLANVELILSATQQTTRTDENGYFVFEGVEPGFHSLTARNGEKVIGYLPFDMEMDSKTDVVVLEDGSCTVSVDENGAGVELHLVLNEELGTMAPAEIGSIEKPDPDVPQTGDETHLLFWLILLLISTACIAVSETYRRKKM